MIKWLKEYELSEELKTIDGYYDELKDFSLDCRFVLIRINKIDNVLELAVVNSTPIHKKFKVTHIIKGKKPQDIYWVVSQQRLLTLPEHYAYLGKELQKAFYALKENKEYIQDEP